MKKIIMLLVAISGFTMISSCVSSVGVASEKIDFQISLTNDDLILGPVVTGEAALNFESDSDYAIAVEAAKSLAKFHALDTEDQFDLILFPRYKVEYKTGHSPIVTVVGRAAKVKNK